MRHREINSNQSGRRAFTMVEILTAVAITTLIVFALVSMFNTSTKALLMGLKQKDVWESARATFGMVSTDVEKVTEGGYATVGGNHVLRISMATFGSPTPDSILQLPDTTIIENRLQDFYLLSRDGSRWGLDIYRVIRENVNVGVGTLYRFHTNFTTYNQLSSDNLPIDFAPSMTGNPFSWSDADFIDQASPMVDGVVHMRLVAYDNDGRPLFDPLILDPSGTYEYSITGSSFEFGGETLPASVDLDMFILEPERINEFRAQSGDIAKRNYLEKHIGNIQMFRTRIPIRKDVPELQ